MTLEAALAEAVGNAIRKVVRGKSCSELRPLSMLSGHRWWNRRRRGSPSVKEQTVREWISQGLPETFKPAGAQRRKQSCECACGPQPI
jgi:hypothetical protein